VRQRHGAAVVAGPPPRDQGDPPALPARRAGGRAARLHGHGQPARAGAHHDANQFVYDLELLALQGRLGELHAAVRDVVERDTARSRWLRDLTVFEGYHESLLAAVERALADGPAMTPDEARDPDISFAAYLRWCARQPETPAATLRAWREGRFSFESQLAEAS
jgi:hypothetical protein